MIHATSTKQVLRNASIAHDAGADGVFLINHGMSDNELLQIHKRAVVTFPQWWVGVNCLGLCPEDVFPIVSDKVAGVWVDNALIQEEHPTQPDAERVITVQQQYRWRRIYFGGGAFKYQRTVRDLAKAARIASRYIDVVTTSGPGTGQAAALEKIQVMKEALDDFPLAIASGITPENAVQYLPWADCVLVATGISRTFEEFDPQRTQDLVNRVRSFLST
jgi:predicted TIM-barrel enzyme